MLEVALEEYSAVRASHETHPHAGLECEGRVGGGQDHARDGDSGGALGFPQRFLRRPSLEGHPGLTVPERDSPDVDLEPRVHAVSSYSVSGRRPDESRSVGLADVQDTSQ
jgi:hypothetical protein